VKNIIKLGKGLYGIANEVVMLLGIMLLLIIVVNGVNNSPLSLVSGYGWATGNLSSLTSGYMPYIFDVLIIVWILGSIIKLVYSIIKGIKDRKKKTEEQRQLKIQGIYTGKVDNGSLLSKLFKWFISN
jgi:hypothetical protein